MNTVRLCGPFGRSFTTHTWTLKLTCSSRGKGTNRSGQDLIAFLLKKLNLNEDHLSLILTEFFHSVFNREFVSSAVYMILTRNSKRDLPRQRKLTVRRVRTSPNP